MTLTIGSLASGIGGFEMGLEMAGFGPVLWQVEIDEYCNQVLAKHWPVVQRYRDMNEVAKTPEVLAPVDIICGGTPCQDMSSAGKQAGIEGSRSKLWFSMLQIVAYQRPKYVVWENVHGCIRRGLDRVVEGLSALGYTVVGTRLQAKDVGAPHRRERVFLVAIKQEAAVADRSGHKQQLSSVARPEDRNRTSNRSRWSAEPDVGRVVYGLPARAHRIRCLGNAIIPQCAEVAGRLIQEFEAGSLRLEEA